MNCFAGNMLHLIDRNGVNRVVCSRTAFDSLRQEQRDMLCQPNNNDNDNNNNNNDDCVNTAAKTTIVVVVDIDAIELVGGGSARCMMAEVFYDNDQPRLN
jgi:hypothetical protein